MSENVQYTKVQIISLSVSLLMANVTYGAEKGRKAFNTAENQDNVPSQSNQTE